ncbi:Cupredoxin-like domain [Candidatus Nitrososphaera evergladensis SR1]|uniref:Cupredoxin-like domain n=1 Tax=Candidatus Nitrososphaera evergladensis SR1 TaxID=1459636 RepID=A0A075MMX5_9ARCH|nr:cupredoxin domain-containing protein [Candidatus Nitrososphaera evergladensis]AIF82801.1 Cupredoxin-like domain [Candidatus Nitrososphaera evergladensis SR1]
MDARKTKIIVPIVIAIAIAGTAVAVLSSTGGAQRNNVSTLATSGLTSNNYNTDSSAAASTSTTTTATDAKPTAASTATSSSIKMSAKEEDETYRWVTSDGGSNPSLKMSANTDNVVQIDNPTDAKHELVINDSSGKEVGSSGDIAPNGSGQLSFKPTAAGTFEYHCEYHPDTMKGTIEVSGSPS